MGLQGRLKSMIILLVLICFMAVSVPADDDLTYQGNKARITIGKIKDKAKGCNYEIAQSVGEMLSTALSNTDRFIVLASQEEVDELIDEIELGQSDYVEAGRGADKGLMEGADILVSGAVTGFEPDAGGSGGALGGLTKKAFGAIGAKKKEAKILLDIKLIDIRTRRIIKAMSLEGKATKWKTGAVGGGWTKDIALAGALGSYSNEPMEGAVRELLRNAVNEITQEIPKEYYRYQGQGQYTQEYGATAQQQQTAQVTSATASGASGTSGAASSLAAPTAAIAENMSLYTRYDFIPGNKVIFFDDMANEEVGEFPLRWDLEKGVYEVVKFDGEFWIMPTDDGNIIPKMPKAPFPDKYTVELEFFCPGPEIGGNYFYIYWVDCNNKAIGEFLVYSLESTYLALNGKTYADKPLPKKLSRGTHTMRIMATTRSIKCYVDEVRVANVPKIENFNPCYFKLRHRPYSDPKRPTLFKGFRFAEGGKSMREQLDESGKIVTHGILFDVSSHKIKGESYKTLQEIGELLSEDPNLRISIEGHTDSDGADDYNQELSQKRAESVRSYIINEFGISADRLEARGWGEQKPLDTNKSSEGKANNRRVELVKI